jgi:hypothetical protein
MDECEEYQRQNRQNRRQSERPRALPGIWPALRAGILLRSAEDAQSKKIFERRGYSRALPQGDGRPGPAFHTPRGRTPPSPRSRPRQRRARRCCCRCRPRCPRGRRRHVLVFMDKSDSTRLPRYLCPMLDTVDDPAHMVMMPRAAPKPDRRRALELFAAFSRPRLDGRFTPDIVTEKYGWKAYVAIFTAVAFVSTLVTPVAIMTFDNFKCRTPPADWRQAGRHQPRFYCAPPR